MTDYKNLNQEYFDNLEITRAIQPRNFHVQNEKSGLISKNLDNDAALKNFYEYKNTFKPRMVVKDPKTFCFFSSAEMRYNNAQHNIINYYPFDGTQREFLDWHTSSSPLEVAMVEKHWPSSVGHLQIENLEYVNFYAGPQNIQTAEHTGRYKKGETPLKIDFKTGNTAEFWLKKASSTAGWMPGGPQPTETVFEIGAHPLHVTSDAATFRVDLKKQANPASGTPFTVTYKLGNKGVDAQTIGTGVTTNSVADDNWHHYTFRGYQSGSDNKVYVDMFIDGKKNSTIEATCDTLLASQDSYMAGTIGAPLNSSQGTITGSLDSFRFWKGQRTNRQINRYYDQRVYASDLEEDDYTSRLGVCYRFNKTILNDSQLDELVIDYSGNDMTGKILNYNSNSRIDTSGIDLSSASSNTEIPDLSLIETDGRVSSLKQELTSIARSYDKNNHNSIMKMIPDWANDPYGDHATNRLSDFYILLNMVAEEFDEIKLNADSIKFLINRNFDSNHSSIGSSQQEKNSITNTDQASNFQCSDKINDLDIWPGNRIDFPRKNLEKLGFSIDASPLELNINPEDDFENILGNVRLTMHPSDVKNLILDNVLIAANSILKKKGTERSFEQLISCWGVDKNLISFNVYGQNAEINLDEEYKSSRTLKISSFDFSQSPTSVLYMTAATPSEEKDYIPGAPLVNGHDPKEDNLTLEGNFIFPKKDNYDDTLVTTSVFGMRSITIALNRFTIPSPDNAKIQVNIKKLEGNSQAAKFMLTSSAGNIETDYIENVYDNSKWNISVGVQKVGSTEQRFLSGSSGTDTYQVVFSGYNYVLDSLQKSFKKTQSLTRVQYTNFIKSDKTLFIGANRQSINSSFDAGTDTRADFKFINMKAWNTVLSDEEIKDMSQNIQNWGLRNASHFETDYNADDNSPITAHYNRMNNRKLLFKIDVPSGLSSIPSSKVLKILDFTSGSVQNRSLYGDKLGSKYPFSSTILDPSIHETILNTEYINVIKSQPPELVRSNEEVQVKTSELDKFKVNITEESKIISFEKSMYRQISEEMINFLSGIKPLNNLIGAPINKYRPNYKLLQHFRQKFFENVENENQFERYVEYYRWIDYALGRLLEQIVPATAQSNTGLHNVIESHVLERNKYQHKAPVLKTLNKRQALESGTQSASTSRVWTGLSPSSAAEQGSPLRVVTEGNNRTEPNGQSPDDVSNQNAGKPPAGG